METAMERKNFRDLMNRVLSPERQANVERRVERELLEMNLREMREMAGETQMGVAGRLKKAQSEISELERRDDFFMSTLHQYVSALGGQLEIVARFGDRSVRLRGVGTFQSPREPPSVPP